MASRALCAQSDDAAGICGPGKRDGTDHGFRGKNLLPIAKEKWPEYSIATYME